MSIPQLDYAPADPTEGKHSRIYTICLIVFGFFILLGAAEMVFMTRLPGIQATGKLVFELLSVFYMIYVVVIAVTIVLRFRRPNAGRTATKALNIVILPLFPFGTALGIYGIWKVDKPVKQMTS